MLKIIVLSVALSYLGAGLPVNSSATTILAKIKSTATYSIKCSEAVKRSVLSWNGHTDCRQFRYGLMALEQVLLYICRQVKAKRIAVQIDHRQLVMLLQRQQLQTNTPGQPGSKIR